MGPAEQECPQCSYKVGYLQYTIKHKPVLAPDDETWYMPCCEMLCGWCSDVLNINTDIYQYQSSISAYVCNACYVQPRPRPEPRFTQQSGCTCQLCRPHRVNSTEKITQWQIDELHIDADQIVAGAAFSTQSMKDCETVNPIASMAEFYVCDYVIARATMSHRYGFTLHNPSQRSDYLMRSDAKTYQEHLVALLEPIFRDYLLCAIGGEARHHWAANMPGGRASSWEWFAGMALVHGRVYMLDAARALFADYSAWSSGFGGQKWQSIANVLLARERGEIDAKTFVDRVFSLQHNGGSALNKFCWKGMCDLSCMQEIGEAHAADTADMSTLFAFCRRALMDDLIFANDGDKPRRLSTFGMPEIEREEWELATQSAMLRLEMIDEGPKVPYQKRVNRRVFGPYFTWWYQ